MVRNCDFQLCSLSGRPVSGIVLSNDSQPVNPVREVRRSQYSINRVPIPAEVDPFDQAKQLNNTTLFPNGSPVAAPSFGWFPLCGTMSQSLESDKVWENQLHYLVYTAP